MYVFIVLSSRVGGVVLRGFCCSKDPPPDLNLGAVQIGRAHV